MIRSELPSVAPDNQQVWLIEGTGLSGKTTVTRTLEKQGFEGIGRGHHLRGITSLFLEQVPGQIESFSPEELSQFLEDKADMVQEVLRGEYDPEYERRSPLINRFVPLVSETEAAQETINSFTFEELGLMSARGVQRVAVEGRALPEIFSEGIVQGKFLGIVVGNTHLTVSRAVAGDRAERKSQISGETNFDREAVLERLDVRNETDRIRDRHPMVLDPNAYVIDRQGYEKRAVLLGGVALVHSSETGIPRCIHIHTDLLDEAAMGRTMSGLVEGALAMLPVAHALK